MLKMKWQARYNAEGFTLVELLIAIVVVGILAAIALPNFTESIRKSRRSEAFTAIAAVQQAQERWRSNNSAYAESVSILGISGTTPGGYYSVAVGSSSAIAYIVQAEAVSGTSQASDTACRKLAVRMQGGNLQYAGCSDCETFNFGATHACWVR